jgi:hypothetical protein
MPGTESPSSPVVHLSVPMELPTAARLEEIAREEIAKAAREQLRWLTNKQAAEYVGWGFRTWERRKKKLGIPVSIIDGSQSYLRDDLDAVLLGHVTAPGSTVVNFPSLELRRQVMNGKAVAA